MHQEKVGGARRKAREEEERQDATNSLQVGGVILSMMISRTIKFKT